MQTYVARNDHAVKIGRSRTPLKRLTSLQTGSSSELKILMTIEGDCEKELHERFDKYRIRREWFSLDILSFYNWMSLQVDRNDEVGTFARDSLHIDCVRWNEFPVFETQYEKLKDHLLGYGACWEAQFALARCYRAWQRIQRGLGSNVDRGIRFRENGEYTGTWIYG